MNLNKLAIWIVGLVVGSMLFAGLLVPVINTATAETQTYHNEGAFYVTSKTPYSMEINNGVYTINGKITPINLTNEYSLITTDKFALRNYNGDAARPVLFADVSNVSTTNYTIRVEIDEQLHATVIRDLAGTETTNEFDLEYFYGLTPEKTDKVMSIGGKPIYIVEDSEIGGTGRTDVTAWSNLFEVHGTLESISVTPIRGEVTITNIGADYEEVADREGYVLNKITFDADTTSCTYDRFIVPESVTMDKTHMALNASERAILGVVPILMIGVLIAYAATAIRNKY